MSQSKFKVGSLLGSAALVAFGVAFAGQATAGDARVIKNSKKQVSLAITGQFSREMSLVDDGHTNRVRHADSNFSSSRFRMIGKTKVNSNLSLQAVSEIAFDDTRNSLSNAEGAANRGRTGAGDLRTRKAELIFTHNQLGRVYMGAGSAGADGIMNINTHGVYSALPGFMGLIGAGLAFKSDEFTLTSATLGNTFRDLDFNGRQTRIRYDTPNIGGFMVTVSHSDAQALEGAIRFSGKAFDSRIKAGAGIAKMTNSGEATEENYGAMISIDHKSGLGIGGGCATQTRQADVTTVLGVQEDNNANGCMVQGHFKRKFNELGRSTIVVEYDKKENQAAHGDMGTGVGVTFHQHINAAALEVWVKYSHFDLDRDGTSTEDIDIVSLGSRMKF
jgi:hypothetical protein